MWGGEQAPSSSRFFGISGNIEGGSATTVANVFISHSSRDNDVAKDIARWLSDRGFHTVFLDIDTESGIPPGADWERVLYRKIESAQAMILVITPAWHESKWCFVEFAQARALGKAIFPVVVAPGGERYIGQNLQHLDIQRDREGGLSRLAEQLVSTVLNAQGGFPWAAGRSPYPGLSSFAEEDAAVFFGRDDDVRNLIERLSARRNQGGVKLLAVLGASGAGKSSVLRAGVLPRLRREQRDWTVLPSFRTRLDLFGEFARAACEILQEPARWSEWRETLLQEADGFAKLIEAIRLHARSSEALVLITIDQGEELLTLANSNDSKRFFEFLGQATRQDLPCIVLLPLRSDLLGRLQDAVQSLSFDEYTLRPFPRERIRQIIEGPARVARIRVETQLVEAAVADMGTEDALPLLAFMLRELYEACSRSGQGEEVGLELSLAQYRSLGDQQTGLNALESVVQRRADDLLKRMRLSPDDLNALRETFVGAMTRIDDEGRYASQPAIWIALPEASRSVLEEFAKARLVTITEEDGVRNVEVAHEALLRKWPLLKNWLDAEREFLVGRNQLRYAADQWTKSGEKNSALLHGLQLTVARQWLTDHPGRFTPVEGRLILASIREDDLRNAREKRLRRGRWAGAAGLAALLLIVVFLSWEGRAAHAEADAASLAVQANLTVAYDPLKAVDLARTAVEKHASISSNSALLESVLSVSPNLLRVWHLGGFRPAALALSSDTSTIASAGERGISIWHGFDPGAPSPSHANLDKVAAQPGVRAGMLAVAWVNGDLFGLREDGTLVITDAGGRDARSVKLLNTTRITAGAIGRSGKLILADLEGQTIQVFDCAIALAQRTATCAGRVVATGYPTALAIDDQDHSAAVGLEQGDLQIVSLSGGPAPPRQLAPVSSRITALAWSPQGDTLAAGTLEGRTLLLGLNGSIQTASEGQDPVTTLGWNHAGDQLASAYSSRHISVRRISESRRTFSTLLARFSGHTDVVRSLMFSADDRMLLSVADDDTARLWSLKSVDPAFAQLPLESHCVLTALTVSMDQKFLAAADNHGHVYVWSMQDQSLVSSIAALDQQIDSLAWSPDGSKLGLGGSGGAVTIVDRSGKKSTEQPSAGSSAVTGLEWLPNGSAILTSGETDGSIHSLSVNGESDISQTLKEGVVLGLAIDPTSGGLFATDDQKRWWTWKSVNDSSPPRSTDTGANRDTVALSPDAHRLVVAGNDGNALVYERNRSGAPVSCRTGERQLDGAAFSSDGKMLAAISSDATLYVWRASGHCDLVAYASLALPGAASSERSLYRPRLISLPRQNVFVVIDSSSRVLFLPADPGLWLDRARVLAGISEQTSSRPVSRN